MNGLWFISFIEIRRIGKYYGSFDSYSFIEVEPNTWLKGGYVRAVAVSLEHSELT